MTSSVWSFAVALSALAADRLVKYLAVLMMKEGQTVPVVPGVLSFTLVHNTGAAFGMLKGKTAFFNAVSVLVILAIAIYLVKSREVEKVLAVSLGLIAGGALGNLIDRVWLGYVVDLLDLHIWPVFNVADSCITIGTIMLAVNILTQSSKQQ